MSRFINQKLNLYAKSYAKRALDLGWTKEDVKWCLQETMNELRISLSRDNRFVSLKFLNILNSKTQDMMIARHLVEEVKQELGL